MKYFFSILFLSTIYPAIIKYEITQDSIFVGNIANLTLYVEDLTEQEFPKFIYM